MNRYDVLGVKVNIVNIDVATSLFFNNIDLARNSYVCCANVHTVVYANEKKHYKEILNNSFMTLPDGGPIANKGKKNNNIVKKVSGVDFMESILQLGGDYNHYFYGESKQIIEYFVNYVKEKYQNIKICGFKESSFKNLSKNEYKKIKDDIVQSKADVVWVALGAPRQEEFCAYLCKNTNACFVAVGGAFKVISNIIPRAPKWMQDHSLEWFYRFLKEPKRLFKRYFMAIIKYYYYQIKRVLRNA